MFDYEMIVRRIPDAMYQGSGNWSGTCPCCESQGKKLSLMQEELKAKCKVIGYGTKCYVHCYNGCSKAQVIEKLFFDNCDLIKGQRKSIRSSGEGECIDKSEYALKVIKQEFYEVNAWISQSNIKPFTNEFSERIDLLIRGLNWLSKDGLHFIEWRKDCATLISEDPFEECF
jgi:hypothetical protein